MNGFSDNGSVDQLFRSIRYSLNCKYSIRFSLSNKDGVTIYLQIVLRARVLVFSHRKNTTTDTKLLYEVRTIVCTSNGKP